MGVNKDMDLFETVHDKLGCEYISDMRSCRALLTDAKKVVYDRLLSLLHEGRNAFTTVLIMYNCAWTN